MVYAGFWRRFGAWMVDLIVIGSLGLLFIWFTSHSRVWTAAFTIVGSLLFSLYSIVLHAKGGRTLGKMAAGIRVVAVQGEHIGWYRSFLRSSVETIVLLISSTIDALALSRISDAVFEAAQSKGAFSEEYQIYAQEMQNFGAGSFLEYFWAGWYAAGLITLLISKKNRAIHDFIAGTVVVVDNPKDGSGHIGITDHTLHTVEP